LASCFTSLRCIVEEEEEEAAGEEHEAADVMQTEEDSLMGLICPRFQQDAKRSVTTPTTQDRPAAAGGAGGEGEICQRDKCIIRRARKDERARGDEFARYGVRPTVEFHTST